MERWLEYASCTDVGTVRTNNEDFADLRDPGDGELQDLRGTVFAVADGMGGLAAGEIASRLAVETLMDSYYGNKDGEPAQALDKAFKDANRLIVERARKHIQETSMGTTLTTLSLVREQGWYAHVGDSRLYLLRDGKLKTLTCDHTLAQEQLRRGDISEEEAVRSQHRSLLTRALGLQDDLEVDTGAVDLLAGDVFLICSDGLYNFLTPDEIRDCLGGEAKEACGKLISTAKEKGSDDNITAQVIRIKGAAPRNSRITVLAPAVFISLLLLFLLVRLLSTGGPSPSSKGPAAKPNLPQALSAGFECVDFALGKKFIYFLGLDKGGTRISRSALSGGKPEPFWYRANQFAARPNGMAVRLEEGRETLYFIYMGRSLFRDSSALPGIKLKDATCLALDDINSMLYIAEGKNDASIRKFSLTAEGPKEAPSRFADHLDGPVRRILPAGADVYILDSGGIRKASSADGDLRTVIDDSGISDLEVDGFGRLYMAFSPSRLLTVTREGEDIEKATRVTLQVLPIKMALDGMRNLWCLEKSRRGIIHPQPLGWIRQ